MANKTLGINNTKKVIRRDTTEIPIRTVIYTAIFKSDEKYGHKHYAKVYQNELDSISDKKLVEHAWAWCKHMEEVYSSDPTNFKIHLDYFTVAEPCIDYDGQDRVLFKLK